MLDDKGNYISQLAIIGKNVDIGFHNIIEKDVIIGDNVNIGSHNIIMENSQIGDFCNIQHYVLLKEHTVIGSGCYIDSYVRSSGDNKIGNNVTLRFGSTIARKVFVEDGVFISPNVMTVYSKHTNEKTIGTFIKRDSYIGTAAVLGPNIIIGRDVVIAAQAYVSKDCIKKGIYMGVPAKFKKDLE